jgi:Na+-transporting methylmalonyl-CoA/oxaloacetate decarboxylase gamma subunit
MSKSLAMFLMGMGMVFVVVLIVGIGLYLFFMWGESSPVSALSPSAAPTSQSATAASSGNSEGTPFVLSESQKGALSMLGVDPASIPSTITKSQEACFVVELGVDRVAEIKAGASPSAADFFKASGCL